jgi:hypothetical protein
MEHERPRSRFRISTLMLLVVIIAVSIALVIERRNRERESQRLRALAEAVRVEAEATRADFTRRLAKSQLALDASQQALANALRAKARSEANARSQWPPSESQDQTTAETGR